jgi:hypothetical protein
VSCDRRQTREVAGDWEVSAAEWLPDGKRIAFIGVSFERPIGSKSDLWVIDAQGGEPECRTAGLVGVGGGRSPYAHVPTRRDGASRQGRETAYVKVQEGGAVCIDRVALTPES